MKKVFLLVSLALVLGLVIGCPQPNDSGSGGSSSGNGGGGENVQEYTLTQIDLAISGSRQSTHAVGERVAITSVGRAGYEFTHWTTRNGGSFEDANAPVTTFTMPANDVTIEAHFSLIPATIVVNNVEITEANKDNVLGNNTVSFDSETQTLTLDGAKLTTPSTSNDALIDIVTANTVTINLVGENTMSGGDGIYVGGTGGHLTITGSGSLTFDGQNNPSYAGIYLATNGVGNFSMDSGTLTINNASSWNGVFVNEMTLSNNAVLEVTGNTSSDLILANRLAMSDSAVLRATGTGSSVALSLYQFFTMTGGEIIASASNGDAISLQYSSLTKGTITATSVSSTGFSRAPTLASGSQYAVMQAGESESNVTTNETNTTTFTNGKYVHIEVTN